MAAAEEWAQALTPGAVTAVPKPWNKLEQVGKTQEDYLEDCWERLRTNSTKCMQWCSSLQGLVEDTWSQSSTALYVLPRKQLRGGT